MSHFKWGKRIGPIDVVVIATTEPDRYQVTFEWRHEHDLLVIQPLPWFRVSFRKSAVPFAKAAGKQLDAIGASLGVSRETDSQYRARIMGSMTGLPFKGSRE